LKALQEMVTYIASDLNERMKVVEGRQSSLDERVALIEARMVSRVDFEALRRDIKEDMGVAVRQVILEFGDFTNASILPQIDEVQRSYAELRRRFDRHFRHPPAPAS
jgi:hypothetical protein